MENDGASPGGERNVLKCLSIILLIGKISSIIIELSIWIRPFLGALQESIANVSLVDLNLNSVNNSNNLVVKNLLVGESGLWMSLYESEENGKEVPKGIISYDWKEFTSSSPALEGKRIHVFLVEKEEKGIWIGFQEKDSYSDSKQGSLKYFGLQNGKLKDSKDFQPINIDGKIIYSLVRDGNNSLWVGTDNGVCLIESKQFQCKKQEKIDKLCSPPKEDEHIYGSARQLFVNQMLFDAEQNVLWMATDRGIIRVLIDQQKATTCYDKHKFGDKAFNSLMLSKNGFLWAGTYSGDVIIIKNRKELKKFDLEESDWNEENIGTSQKIKVLKDLPNNFVLAGTDGGGLFLYNPLTRKWSLISNIKNPNTLKALKKVYDIVLGNDNHLWLATNRGLYKSNKAIE